ncbi:T-complex protein 1 subunit alpha-like isoform X2 [Ananas comosus]|uniref:T-complex protein 1 subunit alpha-like isoform X2 n=1 Tax=Ananas comosus TaxID=4615 RepID=A0A6P5FAT6_ANACO|nr:T-complex protein 1 subunit alpha-like isoform X2 [Ananas comosus]
MAIAAQTPDILGERQTDQDVRTQNAVVCQAVANIFKSSLGPVGLDKILVGDIGYVTITNDGATILKMLEVEHLGAKILVEPAELQDRERANVLVRNKIHPSSVVSGYKPNSRFIFFLFLLRLSVCNGGSLQVSELIQRKISKKIKNGRWGVEPSGPNPRVPRHVGTRHWSLVCPLAMAREREQRRAKTRTSSLALLTYPRVWLI